MGTLFDQILVHGLLIIALPLVGLIVLFLALTSPPPGNRFLWFVLYGIWCPIVIGYVYWFGYPLLGVYV